MGRRPLVVNIGDGHLWLCGSMVSPACGWGGGGVTGAMGEVVGYSGTLRGRCAWGVFTKQSRLQGLGVQPPEDGLPRPRRACSGEGRGLHLGTEAEGGSLKRSHLRRRAGWVPGASWLDQEGAQGRGAGSYQHACLTEQPCAQAMFGMPGTRSLDVHMYVLEQGALSTTSHGAFKIGASNT